MKHIKQTKPRNNGNVIQDENNYYEYNDFNQLIRVRGNNSNGA